MMRVAGRLFLLVILLSVLVGCQEMVSPIKAGKKTVLFNGKDLSGWKMYVADKTVDVDEVWSAKNGVMYCTGRPNGYIRTKTAYKNYKLHLEWRWPGEPANSGVLLHASGEDKLWPRCIESQLMAGNAGDLVLMSGAGITVDGQSKQDPSRFVIIKKKEQSSEMAPGRWNVYQIYCEGGLIRCYVNGVLQNEGTNATVTSGWICLQSEGGPIEFRNIYIESLDF